MKRSIGLRHPRRVLHRRQSGGRIGLMNDQCFRRRARRRRRRGHVAPWSIQRAISATCAAGSGSCFSGIRSSSPKPRIGGRAGCRPRGRGRSTCRCATGHRGGFAVQPEAALLFRGAVAGVASGRQDGLNVAVVIDGRAGGYGRFGRARCAGGGRFRGGEAFKRDGASPQASKATAGSKPAHRRGLRDGDCKFKPGPGLSERAS